MSDEAVGLLVSPDKQPYLKRVPIPEFKCNSHILFNNYNLSPQILAKWYFESAEPCLHDKYYT